MNRDTRTGNVGGQLFRFWRCELPDQQPISPGRLVLSYWSALEEWKDAGRETTGNVSPCSGACPLFSPSLRRHTHMNRDTRTGNVDGQLFRFWDANCSINQLCAGNYLEARARFSLAPRASWIRERGSCAGVSLLPGLCLEWPSPASFQNTRNLTVLKIRGSRSPT